MAPQCFQSPSASLLPVSMVFSRLGGSSSSLFHCEPTWSGGLDSSSFQYDDTAQSYSYGNDKLHRTGHRDELVPCPTANRPRQHSMPWIGPSHSVLRHPQHFAQVPKPEHSNGQEVRRLLPSMFSSTRPDVANCSAQRRRTGLLPPINLTISSSTCLVPTPKPSATNSLVKCGSPPSPVVPEYSCSSPKAFHFDTVPENPIAVSYPQRRSGHTDALLRQPSLHKTSGSRELRQQARWPLIGTRHSVQARNDPQSHLPTISSDDRNSDCEQPLTPTRQPKSWVDALSNEECVEEAHLTTVTSPSKPRLVTISPRTPTSKKISLQPVTPLDPRRALVSAFSPDTPATPPETPDVANPNVVDAKPTRQNVNKDDLASFDTEICYPFTPPSSRIPTPFDKITSSPSACLRVRSRWVPPTMTQLDPSTAWILQELEALLADFPRTALRLNSPVITRIRTVATDGSISDPPVRHRTSIAPHSRYSPYRPLSSHPMSPQHRTHEDQPSGPAVLTRTPQADPTAFALRTIFPRARAHQLDSLQATYLALQYIISVPTSEFTAASASDVAAVPFTGSIRHSRPPSIMSNIPAKARAMLGLDSPVRSPTPLPPSPAMSWFRAQSPELDSEVKTRLENVELLLETSVRRVLDEVEERPLGESDEALVRAVGEVIKMGERKNHGAGRWL